VGGTHHHTFHDGLSADEGGFLAAFQDRHELGVGKKTEIRA
jgi:hypothetical protein